MAAIRADWRALACVHAPVTCVMLAWGVQPAAVAAFSFYPREPRQLDRSIVALDSGRVGVEARGSGARRHRR